MHSFIPHKNNPHVLRKFWGVIIVMSLSAAAALFLQFNFFPKKAVLQAEQKEQLEALETAKFLPEAQLEKQPEKAEALKKEIEQKTESLVADDGKIDKLEVVEAIEPAKTIVRGKDPRTKLEEAKNYAKPQILEGKYIDISLEHQNMVLFENGEFVDAYLVSSGKKGFDTPKGTYRVENKTPRAWSGTYGLFMPWWMALIPNGKIGIHELPIWPNGYREGSNHLGVPVSHGCVRLGVGPAKRVYEWADIGTPVIIHE